MRLLVRKKKLIPVSTLIFSSPTPLRHGPIPNPNRLARLISGQPSTKFLEYEMHSVTWGVIQGRKERLVSRVISDYLNSIGVVPDELEHLELPSTVDVILDRGEFVRRRDITVDDINDFPRMLGCSVRENVIPVIGYLENIDNPRPKLGESVRRYPQGSSTPASSSTSSPSSGSSDVGV